MPRLRPGIVGPKGLNRFGVLDPVAVSKVVGRAMHDDLAPCVLYLDIRQCSRTAECQESPVGAIDIAMKPFHEWLAMREGLWLNDKNSVIGLSRLNPLPKNSAVNKSLAKGPAKAKAMPGVAAATPKPFKAMAPAAFKP